MTDRVEFRKSGGRWNRTGDIYHNTSFELVELKVKLLELVAEIDEYVDAFSAEGQLDFEIAQRMSILSSRAQAAGMLAAMWHDQTSRYYKEREQIESIKSRQGY